MEPSEHLLSSPHLVAYRLDASCLLPTYVSPGAQELLGMDPEDLIAPKTSWSERIHPDDRPWVHRSLDRLRDQERTQLSYRVLGQPGYFWIRDEVLRDGDFFVGHWLRDSSRASQTDFLRNLSHEFRTPMTGAIGMAQLLLESGLGDEETLYAQTILRCNDRLLRLIDNLLDFSHLEMGHAKRETSHFDPLALLERLAASAAAEAAEKGLHLFLVLDPKIPTEGIGDRRRVEQIIRNLVDNAIKFTQEGRCTVTARLSTLGLEVEIVDTGQGLPREAEQMFELFRQGDPSPRRRHGGLGLGLAVCMGFARLLGAELEAHNLADGGSRFLCNFPVQWTGRPFCPDTLGGGHLRLFCEDEVVQESALHWAVSWGLDTSTGPEVQLDWQTPLLPSQLAKLLEERLERSLNPDQLQVLVVEDNPGIQAVVGRLLERMGHSVEVANDGQEAVQAARQGSWDLILMDCQMPLMNGFEATRAIRRLGGEAGKVPIVALTANTLEGDLKACLGAGMNDYLSKPVRRADLERILTGGVANPEPERDVVVLAQDVLDGLLELSEPGPDSFFANLVRLFDSKGKEEIAVLHRLLAEEKGPALSIAAHGLKSTSATLGALRLVESCQTIETLAKEDKLEECRPALKLLEEEYALALAKLQEQLQVLQNSEAL